MRRSDELLPADSSAAALRAHRDWRRARQCCVSAQPAVEAHADGAHATCSHASCRAGRPRPRPTNSAELALVATRSKRTVHTRGGADTTARRAQRPRGCFCALPAACAARCRAAARCSVSVATSLAGRATADFGGAQRRREQGGARLDGMSGARRCVGARARRRWRRVACFHHSRRAAPDAAHARRLSKNGATERQRRNPTPIPLRRCALF